MLSVEGYRNQRLGAMSSKDQSVVEWHGSQAHNSPSLVEGNVQVQRVDSPNREAYRPLPFPVQALKRQRLSGKEISSSSAHAFICIVADPESSESRSRLRKTQEKLVAHRIQRQIEFQRAHVGYVCLKKFSESALDLGVRIKVVQTEAGEKRGLSFAYGFT